MICIGRYLCEYRYSRLSIYGLNLVHIHFVYFSMHTSEPSLFMAVTFPTFPTIIVFLPRCFIIKPPPGFRRIGPLIGWIGNKRKQFRLNAYGRLWMAVGKTWGMSKNRVWGFEVEASYVTLVVLFPILFCQKEYWAIADPCVISRETTFRPAIIYSV